MHAAAQHSLDSLDCDVDDIQSIASVAPTYRIHNLAANKPSLLDRISPKKAASEEYIALDFGDEGESGQEDDAENSLGDFSDSEFHALISSAQLTSCKSLSICERKRRATLHRRKDRPSSCTSYPLAARPDGLAPRKSSLL